MTTPTPGAASELPMMQRAVELRRRMIDEAFAECSMAEEVMSFFNDYIATPPAPVTEGAQREAVALHGCLVYLIERGSPAEYWAGGSNNNWTSDACEARCYEHEAEAEFVHGGQLGEVRVCAHMFNHVFDEDGRCERCRKNRNELAPPPPDRVRPERVEAATVAELFPEFEGGAACQSAMKKLKELGYIYEGGPTLAWVNHSAPPNDEPERVEIGPSDTIERLTANIMTDCGLSDFGNDRLFQTIQARLYEYTRNHMPAPPNDASGGVTDVRVDAAYGIETGQRSVSGKQITVGQLIGRENVRAIIEAADRARKPGYRQVTLEDAKRCAYFYSVSPIAEGEERLLAGLRSIHAVIRIPAGARE